MKKEWFDEKNIDRIKDHASDGDFESLWSGISNRRDKKKRRFIWFWIWPLMGAAVLGALLMYQGNLDGQKSIVDSPQTLDNIADLSKFGHQDSSATTQDVPSHEAEHQNDNISSASNFLKQIEVASTRKADDLQKAALVAATIGQINQLQPTIQNPLKTRNNDPILFLPTANPVIEEVAQRPILKPISKRPQLVAGPLFFFRSLEMDRIRPNSIPQFSPIKNRQSESKLKFGVTARYAFLNTSLDANDPNRQDWVDWRKAREEDMDRWDVLATLEYKLNPILSLQSGLGFGTSFTYWADEMTDKKTIIRENEVVEIIIHPDGSKTEILGNLEVDVTEITDLKRYNRYSEVYIPIYARLDLPIGRKFHWQLFGGTDIGLKSFIKGETRSPLNDPIGNIPLDQAGYRTAMQFYGVVGTGWSIEVGQSFMLEAGFHARLSLNGIQADGSGFDEKHHTIGAQLGVARKF